LVRLLEEKRNVKWILMISIILFFVSIFYSYPLYDPGRVPPSFVETVLYFLSRIAILFFLATITMGALFTTNFSKKELAFKLTIRLFVLSMVLFFLQFLRILFTIP